MHSIDHHNGQTSCLIALNVRNIFVVVVVCFIDDAAIIYLSPTCIRIQQQLTAFYHHRLKLCKWTIAVCCQRWAQIIITIMMIHTRTLGRALKRALSRSHHTDTLTLAGTHTHTFCFNDPCVDALWFIFCDFSFLYLYFSLFVCFFLSFCVVRAPLFLLSCRSLKRKLRWR